MKIYTKTGDGGNTALLGGTRVSKEDPRIEACGHIDELNAALGLARAEGLNGMDALAQALQGQLFTIGSWLATPQDSKASMHLPHMRTEWVVAMEEAIDDFDRELSPLTSFILPGGTKAAAALHMARTICRRTERRVVPLVREGKIENEMLRFLNRLSDLLFVMARAANHRANVAEAPWRISSTST